MDEIDKPEQKEIIKMRFLSNKTWYSWYDYESCKTNTTKDYSKTTCVNHVYGCVDVERNQDPPNPPTPPNPGTPTTVTLNHEIGIKLQRISKIKLFMNKYYKKGINYPSAKDEWKRFEKIIQLLLLICYILRNNHIFCLISKHNSSHE